MEVQIGPGDNVSFTERGELRRGWVQRVKGEIAWIAVHRERGRRTSMPLSALSKEE